MAENMTNENAGSNLLIPADELATFVKDLSNAKTRASSESGEAGSLTKKFSENFGVSKGAIAVFTKWKRAKDQSKAQGELRDLLRLMASEAAEHSFVGQIDAFDDTVDLMRSIVEKFGSSDRAPDNVIGLASQQ